MRALHNVCGGVRVSAAIVALLVLSPGAYGQTTFTAEGDGVVLNCPDQIELQVLVDYVGKALDLRFIYGDQLKNQRVELRPSPVELPKKHLLGLLASLLRGRELAMVEESPGFYRIVRAEQATRSVSSRLPVVSKYTNARKCFRCRQLRSAVPAR